MDVNELYDLIRELTARVDALEERCANLETRVEDLEDAE